MNSHVMENISTGFYAPVTTSWRILTAKSIPGPSQLQV